MIQIAGTLQALGDLQPEDIPAEAVPRALLTLTDGRVIVISGLTRDECRQLAPQFGDPVAITVKGVTPAAPAVESSYTTPEAPAAVMVSNVLTIPTKPAEVVATTAPSLRLGQINERLSPLSIDAAGLAYLGFPPVAREGAAKLWHEHQWPAICAAIVAHIHARQQRKAA